MSKRSIQIGDEVVAINDTLSGTVVHVESKKIIVLCNDGFNHEYKDHDLIHKDSLEKYLSSKEIARNAAFDSIDKKENQIKNYPKRKHSTLLEIDLHIQNLVKSHKGMSNYDILALQIQTARTFLEEAISKKIQRVIFIHGVGEGVLKNELNSLFISYKVKFHDASFRKYGLGATEVYIIQNTNKNE